MSSEDSPENHGAPDHDAPEHDAPLHDAPATDPSDSDTQNTGPLVVPAPTALWQPRPSGALSAEAWSSPSSTVVYPSGGAAGYGTGQYQPGGNYGQPNAGQQYPASGEQYSGNPTTGQFGGFPGGQQTTGTPNPPTSGYQAYGGGATLGYPGTQRPATGAETPGGGVATEVRPPKPRRRGLVAAAAVVLVLGGGFGAGAVGAKTFASNTTTADSSLSRQTTSPVVSDTAPVVAGSVEAVAAKLLPSVVSILSMSSSQEAEGSGVILSSDGLILTNNHVIAGATDLTVKFNDGTTASAKVIGADATDDLAVIKVSGVSGLTVATLGSSANVKVGEQVVAVGSPLGLSATVTSGIVSALNRPVRTAAEDTQGQQGQSPTSAQDTVLNAIQTDAAINPGNSGGALVDMSGAVIGINSAIASLSSGSSQAGSIGVGFAIPIDQAHRIAQEIINTGHATHAVLGASVGDAPDSNSANATAAAAAGLSVGAKIAKVTDGGGAAAAGLAAGDVITKVGSTTVGSADALIATIRSSTPGSKVVITYLRGSETRTATVTLGSAVSN